MLQPRFKNRIKQKQTLSRLLVFMPKNNNSSNLKTLFLSVALSNFLLWALASTIILWLTACFAFYFHFSSAVTLLPMYRIKMLTCFAAFWAFPAIGLSAALRTFFAGNYISDILFHFTNINNLQNIESWLSSLDRLLGLGPQYLVFEPLDCFLSRLWPPLPARLELKLYYP